MNIKRVCRLTNSYKLLISWLINERGDIYESTAQPPY